MAVRGGGLHHGDQTICSCGSKATVNARIGRDGCSIPHGRQVFLGGNDSCIAMCHRCRKTYIRENRKVR